MDSIPNMILIGSTARNSGKTTLAAALIKKFKRPVIGIKVTTILKKNGGCIRGKEGCGVCSSLKGNFEISEETNRLGQKDTNILLASGADKVYWLKALKDHVAKGFSEIHSQLPEDAIIICESNSLRLVVEPGVFVMMKNGEAIKDRALAVIDLADIIYENPFDENLELLVNEIIDQIGDKISN